MADYEKAEGAVAILDALGTSTQSEDQVGAFLDARDKVLELLDGKVHGVNLRGHVKRFTFGDTILLTLTCDSVGDVPDDCAQFMAALRKFLVDSLQRGLLMRGAVAIGTHYTNDDSNTVLGPAVNDAAAWYEEAEWIGLHLTPHASMRLQEWREAGKGPPAHLVVDYEVPLKTGPQILKAVNWPKVLFVNGLAPLSARKRPREYLLHRLTARSIPKHVETKYTNTLAFFDHIVTKQNLKPLEPKRIVKKTLAKP